MGSPEFSLVLVTGASGFLASHIIPLLLTSGYRVRGALRSSTKAAAFQAKYGGKHVETTVVPDITAAGAFDHALDDGVEYIIHTASPFTFNIKDIEKELLLPAIEGTIQILKAAAACKTIKRVVITSSFAAVVNPLLGPRKGYSYTESDWNPLTKTQALSTPLFGYQGSKAYAEKTAWDFITEKQPGFTIVTVCPPMIFGPVLQREVAPGAPLNESSAQLLRNVNAETPGETRMPVFVDVRDVAKVHVRALDEALVQGSERFVVCGGKFTWAAAKEIAEYGRASEKSMAAAEEYYEIDASKAEKMLQIKWTSLEQSIKDSLKSIKGLSNL